MIRLDYSVDDFVRICRHVASHRGLVPDKHFHPEAFRNSPTVKTFKQYANNTNRIMMLDKPTFEVLLIGDCTYCGKKSVPGLHQNGVDRINSRNRRYELGNVVTCCKTCNSVKWTLSIDKFMSHVRQVALYFDFNIPIKIFSSGENAASAIII